MVSGAVRPLFESLGAKGLKNEEDISILQADKGDATVIMSNEVYHYKKLCMANRFI